MVSFTGTPTGNVQLVDFPHAFGMLDVPHPLLADYENFSGGRRRTGVFKIQAGSPEE
jgi:hypothetical protein